MKIDVQTARDHIDDSSALLVCAYDSQKKFEDNNLPGAISLDELRRRENELSHDRELIFYCA